MLIIRDSGAAALDFYQRAFDANVLWSAPPEGGMVAQLSAHGAEFWIHPETADGRSTAPPTLGGTTVRLMLIVNDPYAVHAQAIAAGATVINPVTTHDYGWCDGSLLDPFGHRWDIGKKL